MKSRAQKLEQILKLSRDLTSTTDMPVLLERVLRTSVEISEARRGYVVLVRDQKLVFGTAHCAGGEEFEPHDFEASRGLLKQAIQQGQPIRTSAPGVKSIVCLPLFVRQRPVGVLYLDHPEREDAFAEFDGDLLDALTAYAALAIDNLSVQARDAVSVVGELARLMEVIQDPQQLLERALDLIVRVTRAQSGIVAMHGDAGLAVVAKKGSIEEPIMSRTITDKALQEPRAILISDAQSDPRFSGVATITSRALRSVLAAGIVKDNEKLGVLYLENRSMASLFTEEDRTLVEAFAQKLAPALLHSLNYERAVKKIERLKETLSVNLAELGFKYSYRSIVGKSMPMIELLRRVEATIESDYPVIIEGETGTGKELVAKVIHYNSKRKDMPFIAENCGAISKSLMESELFGHKKGAFTGANADRKGLFQIADGGTLFLDEIEEMPEEMQIKLLRALEAREIRPVGADRPYRVDVRIVASSNRDIKQLVKERKFREDLFFRLNVFHLRIPPLRERKEDIPLLVEHFLDRVAEETRQARKRMDAQVVAAFMKYDWPGNVRELENEIRRLVATTPGETIAVPWQPRGAAPGGSPAAVKPLIEVERQAIAEALRATGGNRARAAEMLGISLRALYYKIKEYNLTG